MFLLATSALVAQPAVATEQPKVGQVEIVAELDIPPGNVTAAKDGRIFASVHGMRRGAMQLIEVTGENSYAAFPDASWNAKPGSGPGVLNTRHGVLIDSKERLSVVDHRNWMESAQPPKLVAFEYDEDGMSCSLRGAAMGAIGNDRGRIRLFARRVGLVLLLGPTQAEAHVKWFAPYIVGAPPQPILGTLANPWFWTGIALVLVFFLATRAIEKSPTGEIILTGMDRVTEPLWQRLDEFVCLVIGAFFVAIFAVGGVYLTPDLKTPAEWVSWAQLLIAALVIPRATRPIAAAGIIGLWLLALRDYDIFHLLDYLALGVGVAAYLVLEASNNPEWRKHRFEVLRWGVAIALMWSSLEKFAYPDWFYPLVVEKPFLTFGMPRDVFIPMAGVAEFTMGFGMIWTPLVRRLSAIALFVIFNAAVYPFGRIDLIGHALIMAIIVAIAADHTREIHFLPALKRRLAGIPTGLTAALAIFATGYWGLHVALYGSEGRAGLPASEMATHSHSPEYPHGPQAPGGIGAPPRQDDSAMGHAGHAGHSAPPAGNAATSAPAAYRQAMERMHGPMMQGIAHADPDIAFVLGMIPHHQGAVDMAEIQLSYGKDAANRKLAAEIIAAQKQELGEMREWLRQRNLPQPMP